MFFELGNLRKTRTKIQDKPVELVKFNSENQITHTQILYVNKAGGFNLNKIKSAIEKHQTLLGVLHDMFHPASREWKASLKL